MCEKNIPSAGFFPGILRVKTLSDDKTTIQ